MCRPLVLRPARQFNSVGYTLEIVMYDYISLKIWLVLAVPNPLMYIYHHVLVLYDPLVMFDLTGIISYNCSSDGVLRFLRSLNTTIYITYCNLLKIIILVPLFSSVHKKQLERIKYGPMNQPTRKR